MGLFDWLFKRGASAEQKADQRASSLLADDFLNIPSLQFFGPFSTSANGRYKLAWGSGGGLSTARKAQSRKSGRYLLLVLLACAVCVAGMAKRGFQKDRD